MGCADIIPGVSGGTIAFITGIYDELVQTIAHYDHRLIRLLLKREWASFLDRANLSFLLPLFMGIGMAIISMAKLMHMLMHDYPIYTWSFFFGLILASASYILRKEDRFTLRDWLIVAAGSSVGVAVVSLVPQDLGHSMPVIFFSGMIAICAMILPGISGSFLLLILGQYAFVTGTLKNPTSLVSLQVIAVFGLGCLLGLSTFSKFLHFCMNQHRRFTTLLMCGFMFGSLKKVWPWKEVLETKTIRGKTYNMLEINILPHLDSATIISICLILLGLLMVFGLEYGSRYFARD